MGWFVPRAQAIRSGIEASHERRPHPSFPCPVVRMERKRLEKRRCTVEIDLALLRRYQDGVQPALDDLWEFHIALVYFWAGKVFVKVRRASLDDLRQEACVAFILLAKRFDTSGSKSFHTEIRFTVRTTLFFSPEIRVVKRTLYRNYKKVKDKQDEWAKKLDRKPTVDELSTATGLSVKQVNTALHVLAAFPLQFEETERDFAFEEPHQSEDPYLSKQLEDAINQLKPEHSEVIIRQFVLGHTQLKIANDLGTSVATIKMRVRRAKLKLEKFFDPDGVKRDGTQRHRKALKKRQV